MTAGIISATIVTTTPILVALSRTNNLDMLLLFFLLCGAKFILKASKKQSLPLFLLAMAFIGLGFNIKMLQAYLAVPAYLLIYFLGKGKFIKKLLHTVAAIAVLLVVSFSWAVVIDSIPESERPYVGGSQTNSVVELAIGYNGLTRLLGHQPKDLINDTNPTAIDNKPAQQDGQRPEANMPEGFQRTSGNGGVGGAEENGNIGFLRLYSTQLSGLNSWFLLPATAMMVLACGGYIYWMFNRKKLSWTDTRRQKLNNLIFWSAWLLPMAVFFSIAEFMHRYYVVMLCPAIAALTASCAVTSWKSKHRRWCVPLIVLTTLATQCLIVARSSWTWLLIPMLIFGTASMLAFMFKRKTIQTIAAVLTALALFIAPLAWSLTPAFYTLNSNIPDAGPDADIKRYIAAPDDRTTAPVLLQFLQDNYNGETWALAVPRANMGAYIILETSLPVMAVGGFAGSNPIMTVDTLKEYIAAGDLRYYIMSDVPVNNHLTRWVREHGTPLQLGRGIVIFDLKRTD